MSPSSPQGAAQHAAGHHRVGTAREIGPELSIAVGRTLGTVVVTVEGELTGDGCRLLERLLVDLIEGQGNLAVAIDLARATVEPEALVLFIAAARRASRRGSKVILKALPSDASEAVRSGGLSRLVEAFPATGGT